MSRESFQQHLITLCDCSLLATSNGSVVLSPRSAGTQDLESDAACSQRRTKLRRADWAYKAPACAFKAHICGPARVDSCLRVLLPGLKRPAGRSCVLNTSVHACLVCRRGASRRCIAPSGVCLCVVVLCGVVLLSVCKSATHLPSYTLRIAALIFPVRVMNNLKPSENYAGARQLA